MLKKPGKTCSEVATSAFWTWTTEWRRLYASRNPNPFKARRFWLSNGARLDAPISGEPACHHDTGQPWPAQWTAVGILLLYALPRRSNPQDIRPRRGLLDQRERDHHRRFPFTHGERTPGTLFARHGAGRRLSRPEALAKCGFLKIGKTPSPKGAS